MRATLPAVFALPLLACLACHGCNDRNTPPPVAASPTATPADAAPADAETVVRLDDDGKTFDVPHGSRITFKLASNSGTGYVWTPTRVDPAVLVQQGDRSSEAASDTPGAPKLDVYRFSAGGQGTTEVEMSLQRPFGNAPPGRTIHVTIRVH